MGLLKKFAGETIIYGISVISTRLISFVFLTPYLTNKFENQELYGIHAIMYAYTALLLIFYTHRMETTFFRFGSRTKDYSGYFGSAFLSVVTVALVGTVIMLFFSEPIAGFLTSADQSRYVEWFAFIIAFDAIAAIPFAQLRLEGKAISFTVIKFINVVVTVGLTLFFLEIWPQWSENGFQLGPWQYEDNMKLDYVFIANLLASGLVLLILSPSLFKLKIRFDSQQWKTMIKYAWPLIIVGIAGTINNLSDRFLIKELSSEGLNGEAQTGIYSATARVAMLMMLFITAFNYAAEPFFFKQATNKDNRKIYAIVARLFMIVSCGIFLGVTLFMDIVKYLIAPGYRESLYIAPVLLLAYLFLGLFYNFSIWYKIQDRTSIGAIIASIGSVISLSINFLLIGKIGYEGAAWAALATFGFMAAAGYWTSRRFYPIPYPIRSMIFYLVLALVIFFIGSEVGTMVGPVERTIVGGVLLIMYFGIVYLVHGKRILLEVKGV